MKRVLLVAALLAPVTSKAVTTVFTATGNNDTFLSEQYASTNLDGLSFLWIKGSNGSTARGLIRFDLSSLAGQYITIDQIQLTLTNSEVGAGGTVELHEVATADGDWVASQASWQQKKPGTWWSAGPAFSIQYGATLASASYADGNASNLVFTISNSTAATALVGDFNTGNNEGFLLKISSEANGGYWSANSGDNTNQALRPTLTVTYTPTPEPSSALLLFGGLAMASQRRTRRKA